MRLYLIIILIFSSFILKSQVLDTIVANKVDSIRIKHNIPSVAYGIIRNDTVIVINTVGYRDILTKEKSRQEDYYNIGSNTKAFTSYLAAKIVENDLIKWDTKFFDLYPELKNESDTTYYQISLKELLSHRARLINFKEPEEIIMILGKYLENTDDSLSLQQKRYYLIKEILKHKPLPPYKECEDSYSNAGFIAAALMLEKVSGQSWENLINNLSRDLNIGVYIGSPIELNKLQPKGYLNPEHIGLNIDKVLIPIEIPIRIPVQGELSQLNILFEFLLLCTPAGNISINVNDFLKFLQLNINGINGENNYLKSESYRHIFSTYPNYSMGWGVESNENLIYSHRGSNMMFNSFAGISPAEKLGVVIMINAYNNSGLTEILQLLQKYYSRK